MRRAIAAVIVLAACNSPNLESVDEIGFPDVLASDLQSILDSELESVNAPGATVTVVLPDGLEWSGATGYASLEPERVAVPQDRFRIGSVTKTFVAAISIQLAEEGVWSLDDSIDAWVPGFDLGPEVTLRRLLSHTAGLFDFTGDPDFIAQSITGPSDIVAFALAHDMVGAPGQHYKYSNTGFILMGMAIENALGRTLHAVIRERLLEPYDLQDTYLEGQETLEGGHVSGYVVGVEDTIVYPEFDMNWAWAAGAMVSNGADQCQWARVLVQPTQEMKPPVSEASRTEMQTPQPTTDDGPAPYGLGLMLYHRAGRAVIGHTGSTMGFKGEVFIDAATGACVAIQTNDFASEPGSLRDALWHRLGTWLEQPVAK